MDAKITIGLKTTIFKDNPNFKTGTGGTASLLQLDESGGDLRFSLVDSKGSASAVRFSLYSMTKRRFLALVSLLVQDGEKAPFTFNFYSIMPDKGRIWYVPYDGEYLKSPEPANHMRLSWDHGLLIDLVDIEYDTPNCSFVVDGEEFLRAIKFFDEPWTSSSV